MTNHSAVVDYVKNDCNQAVGKKQELNNWDSNYIACANRSKNPEERTDVVLVYKEKNKTNEYFEQFCTKHRSGGVIHGLVFLPHPGQVHAHNIGSCDKGDGRKQHKLERCWHFHPELDQKITAQTGETNLVP